MCLGLLVWGLSILSLPIAGKLWQFVLLVGLLGGLGAGATGLVPNSITVSQWFQRKRGLALGIASTGISVGSIALNPLLAWIVLMSGWRTGYLLLGGLILLFDLPLIAFFLRNSPDHASQAKIPALAFRKVIGAGLYVPSVWLIGFTHFTCGISDFFIINHLIIYAQGIGFSTLTGAWTLSIFLVSGILGTVILGGLSDRTSPKVLLGIGYFSRALGLFLLGFAVKGKLSLFLFGAIVGFSSLSTIPLITSLTRLLFGQRLMGTVYGLFSMLHHTGAGIGTFLGGLIFDISGSYSSAFLLISIQLAMAGVASLLIRQVTFYWADDKGRFMPSLNTSS
jgi:MFS family permease